jgi:hypothetical protein
VYFFLECNEGRVGELSLAEMRDEVESGSRENQDAPVVQCVPTREGVGYHIRRPRLVLEREIKAQELPHPMVLGNHREPLVQQVFEAVMISLDEEASAPQVRPPVPDGMDEADELPLIGGEGAVPGRDRPAEEGDWVAVLYQHRPKPMG